MVSFVLSLCGRWRPPSVPNSPIRHCSDPSLSCPASPGRFRVVLAGIQGVCLYSGALPLHPHPLWVWADPRPLVGPVLRSGKVINASHPLTSPQVGEKVLPSLDRCPERTVLSWVMAHVVSGHVIPQCFLLPFLSRWLSSGSRAAVAAA